jgi:hypothetical protein
MISSECCTKTRSVPLSLSDIALHCAMLPLFPSLRWSGDCVLRANPESQNTYTCTAHHLGMVQVMRHHLCTTHISVCAYRATSHNLTSIKSANSELSPLSKPPTNPIMCVEPRLTTYTTSLKTRELERMRTNAALTTRDTAAVCVCAHIEDMSASLDMGRH